jgi:hypothetical protein
MFEERTSTSTFVSGLNAGHLGHKTNTTTIEDSCISNFIEYSILRTCCHVCFITDVISNFIGQNVIGINIEPITARVAN